MTSAQKNMIEDFKSSAKDHLRLIENDLLDLETQSHHPDPVLIDRLFRAIHSIKGGAGFAELNHIIKITHMLETMLQKIKDRVVQPDPIYIDGLFQGFDLLKSWIDDVLKYPIQPFDSNSVVHHLSGLIHHSGDFGTIRELDIREKLFDKQLVDFGFMVAPSRMKELGSSYLYIIQYNFNELARKNIMPLDIIEELESMGKIVMTRLVNSASNLDKECLIQPLCCDILYSSLIEPNFIHEALDYYPAFIIVVQRDLSTFSTQTALNTLYSISSSEMVDSDKKLQQQPHQQDYTETVRIQVQLLDQFMTIASELITIRNQFQPYMASDEELHSIGIHLNRVTSDLQTLIMKSRMQSLETIYLKVSRLVRDLSRKFSKSIQLVTEGGNIEIDRTIIDIISDPILHIVRNCCDHGIESPKERQTFGKDEKGRLTLTTYLSSGQVTIEIQDDGRGINSEHIKKIIIQKGLITEKRINAMNRQEILQLIMLPGLTTANNIDEVSGRGIGMDIVKTSIESINGKVTVHSTLGKSTTIIITIPRNLSLISKPI